MYKIPRFCYHCKDCGNNHKSIWVLKFCTNCKSENIIRENLRVK